MFAPIVILVRNYLGKAKFNKLRGQAIAKHSQVITAVSVDGQVFDWRDRQPLIDFYGDSVLVLKF